MKQSCGLNFYKHEIPTCGTSCQTFLMNQVSGIIALDFFCVDAIGDLTTLMCIHTLMLPIGLYVHMQSLK